jgi:aspartyl-tRNA(Asn)/glutamyl-tRNA(Gln) amidotransferase subunit B
MLANPSHNSTKQIAEDLQLTALLSSPSTEFGLDPTRVSPISAKPSELHSLCLDAINALPDEVAAVKTGNKNVLNKIVGRVMRESRGRADARSVKALIEELISSTG